MKGKNMKKVLLLGGSHFQVPSVKCAKRLGYHTITCDYLPDNPGHKFADEYYNVSTTDKEAVLKLAQDLKIDGIVCYASDPSAPTAAYVAEKMGLSGQPYKSVEILSNKDLFRQFLTENGFNVPRARGFTKKEEAHADWDNFKKPVMVKPVDSSGSKGVSKIETSDELDNAIDYALSFSRCKRFIIEEYIEKTGYQVDGDGFSVNGKLVFWAFGNQHNDLQCNPYVPAGISLPYHMEPIKQQKLVDQIQKTFDLLHLQSGAYNFEARFDEQGIPYILEIGPRNGGNLIPQITKYATGVDMIEYTIKAAMGEDISDLKQVAANQFIASYIIHSKKDGILKKINISDEIKHNILEYDMISKEGDAVIKFNGSNGTLGTMILKFDSMEEMLHKMDNMDDYVKVVVE